MGISASYAGSRSRNGYTYIWNNFPCCQHPAPDFAEILLSDASKRGWYDALLVSGEQGVHGVLPLGRDPRVHVQPRDRDRRRPLQPRLRQRRRPIRGTARSSTSGTGSCSPGIVGLPWDTRFSTFITLGTGTGYNIVYFDFFGPGLAKVLNYNGFQKGTFPVSELRPAAAEGLLHLAGTARVGFIVSVFNLTNHTNIDPGSINGNFFKGPNGPIPDVVFGTGSSASDAAAPAPARPHRGLLESYRDSWHRDASVAVDAGGGDDPAPASFAAGTSRALVSAAAASLLSAACVPAAPRAPARRRARACARAAPDLPAARSRPSGDGRRFLDELERRTFDCFWDLANPDNGLVPDRAPTPSFSSIAAVGFGLTAYPIGVERGWVTRDAARERVLTTLRFFCRAVRRDAPPASARFLLPLPRHADRARASRTSSCRRSTPRSSFAGVLFCQSYFDRDDPAEAEIRAARRPLYRDVDWRLGCSRAPLVVAWAGRRRRASTPGTGAATTRR